MRLFRCRNCGQVLYFETTSCERCGHRLGFLAETGQLSAREPEGKAWRTLAKPARQVRFCANAAHDACNWLVPVAQEAPLCLCCRHNRTIPDLTAPGNLLLWQRIEAAKQRLFYTLIRLGLPLADRAEDPEHGLAFDVLADPPSAEAPKVMTGHDNGLITLALAEADDAHREQTRTAMGEPYRTLLGHLRHEVGHHFWDLLVRDGGRLEEFRELFGDEREDYAAALQAHYANGPPADWQARFVSTYASAHPWEDFASHSAGVRTRATTRPASAGAWPPGRNRRSPRNSAAASARSTATACAGPPRARCTAAAAIPASAMLACAAASTRKEEGSTGSAPVRRASGNAPSPASCQIAPIAAPVMVRRAPAPPASRRAPPPPWRR
jgi:hypothetical protein